MSDSISHKTPDEAVADKIMARFDAAGLISEQDRKRTREQLATGRLQAEDWQLLAEKVLEIEAREGDDGQ